jgi:hypothetical protein
MQTFSIRQKLLLFTKKHGMKSFLRRFEEFLLFLEQRRLYQWMLSRSKIFKIIFMKLRSRKRISVPAVDVMSAAKITIPETAL